MSTRLVSGALYVAILGACAEPEAPRSPPPSPPESPEPESEVELPAAGPSRARTVYVPAYSHIPDALNTGRQSLLSVLLSVRNVDSAATITLTRVDYFDTSGHRVRRYLDAPRSLRPLETMEFVVEKQDEAGGSGANFLVYWEGPSDAHPILTEAIMYGPVRAGFATFTSRGVELDRRPDPANFPPTGSEAPAPEPDSAAAASSGPP